VYNNATDARALQTLLTTLHDDLQLKKRGFKSVLPISAGPLHVEELIWNNFRPALGVDNEVGGY
jgi:hypothetical protein